MENIIPNSDFAPAYYNPTTKIVTGWEWYGDGINGATPNSGDPAGWPGFYQPNDGYAGLGCLQIGGDANRPLSTWGEGWRAKVVMTSGKAYTVKLRYKLYSPTYRNNGAKVDICCYTRDHINDNAKHVDYHRGWCNTCDWTEAIVARHVYKPANPAINHPEEYYLYVNINLSRDVSEDRNCYIRIDDVQILEEDAETVTINRWAGSGADFTAWTAPAHYDTKDTDTTPGGALSSLPLQAAGHERALFQAVIRPTATWSAVTVESSGLPTGAVIEARLGIFLNIDRPDEPSPLDIPYGRYGQAVEPLVLESSYSLTANQAYPLFIEIYVPTGTTAGDYSASILVKNSSTTKVTIPITLTVHNFSLPIKSSDHTCKCYAQLGMTARMGDHGETLNVAKMQKYVDDVCGVMYGMTDIGYIDKWFTYNTPEHYVNLRSLGGPIEGREPIDIILSHGVAKGYDEFYPPFGSFGYANSPPNYNPDPATYFNGWTGDGTPVVGNENPACDQAFMDTFNSLKARYEAYGATGKFPYYNHEEEDAGDVPGDHTKTILKRHFFDLLHNAGMGPTMGTGLDGPDDTYSLQDHLDYLFVSHLNTQLEKPNVSRIENLGFYHNGFHQGSTSLTHSLWHWRHLMMGFYLFGYRGGMYFWETTCWDNLDVWSDGDTTETWEVCKGLNINLWYPPINDPSGKGVWLNTPTRSIRLSMMGQGMADVLYAEKLQRLIDTGHGTIEQRAAAQTALDSISDIVKAPLNGFEGIYNEFTTHDYEGMDTWKRAVAGHIEILSAAPSSVHFRRLASVPGSMTLMLLDSTYTYSNSHVLADLQAHQVSGGGAVSLTYAAKTVTIADKAIDSGATPFKYIALVSVDKVGVVWELPEALAGAKTIRFGTITTSK